MHSHFYIILLYDTSRHDLDLRYKGGMKLQLRDENASVFPHSSNMSFIRLKKPGRRRMTITIKRRVRDLISRTGRGRHETPVDATTR